VTERRSGNLIIMTKRPRCGRVKTRLAANIGDTAALEVYRSLLDHVLQLAVDVQRQLDLTIWWFVADDSGLTWAQSFTPPSHNRRSQNGTDLGERMFDAVSTAYAENPAPLLIIGCDCPELSINKLTQLLAAVEQNDAAIIPAHDGGYVALAMTKPLRELFFGPAWGTGTVLSKTLKIARQHEYSLAQMEPCHDLDTVSVLARFPQFNPKAKPD